MGMAWRTIKQLYTHKKNMQTLLLGSDGQSETFHNRAKCMRLSVTSVNNNPNTKIEKGDYVYRLDDSYKSVITNKLVYAVQESTQKDENTLLKYYNFITFVGISVTSETVDSSAVTVVSEGVAAAYNTGKHKIRVGDLIYLEYPADLQQKDSKSVWGSEHRIVFESVPEQYRSKELFGICIGFAITGASSGEIYQLLIVPRFCLQVSDTEQKVRSLFH